MNYLPARYDFPPVLRGDTFRPWKIELRVGDEPIDLTGAMVEMVIKAQKGGEVVKQMPIHITDATGGEAIVDAFNVDFRAYTYLYDLVVTFPNGTTRTYIQGIFKVKQDV